MNLERLYLDYNATSPFSLSVQNWLKNGDFCFSNPSSQHTSGKSSRKVINDTRREMFQIFNFSEKGIKLFFHSGATEAFVSFLFSFSELTRLTGKELLVCYSKIDHPAVLSLAEKYFGPQVKFFELRRNKDLSYSHADNFYFLKDKKDNNPNLVILYHHLWVHNETGQIEDLSELDRFSKIEDLFIHVDAVQAPGKIIDWNKLSCGDIWTFSAHKFGALKGLGFSFFKTHLDFHPLISGGGQQFNLRGGTENTLAIKSISLALSDLLKVDVVATSKIRDELVIFIKNQLQGIGEVIERDHSASNTIYFYFYHLPSDITLALFDLHGFEISAGSACSSGSAKESPLLLHKGLHQFARNGLRLSLPFSIDDDYLVKIKKRFEMVIKKIQSRSE